MTAGNFLFLDTNILVYATVAEAPFHIIAEQAIEAHEQSGVDFWISRQILREYLATLTRPNIFGSSLSVQDVIAQVRFFENRFHVVEDSPRVTERLLEIVEQIPVGGRQIHDANIVATMQAYGIQRLLTHNVADFVRFAHLITVLPLQGTTP